jgi:O-methyltransferase involved in polyketide biosynthesis
VFTYMHPDVAENAESFTRTERLRRTLSRVGERWTSGLHPADTCAFLAERGLELTEDLVASEYRARCLGDTRQGYEFHHVVSARVVGA